MKARASQALLDCDTDEVEATHSEPAPASASTALERAWLYLQLAARKPSATPPANGRTVLIASSRPEERIVFVEHARSRGSAILVPPSLDETLPLALGLQVVLVVIRPETADTDICARVRRAGYDRSLCYLPAGDSSAERVRAYAANAEVIEEVCGEPGWFQSFSDLLDAAMREHPALLRFHTLEVDLDSQQLRIARPNATTPQRTRNLRASLFPALKLLIQRGDEGATLDELCGVSDSSRHESAPRKMLGRLKDVVDPYGVTIANCGRGRYRLVPAG